SDEDGAPHLEEGEGGEECKQAVDDRRRATTEPVHECSTEVVAERPEPVRADEDHIQERRLHVRLAFREIEEPRRRTEERKRSEEMDQADEHERAPILRSPRLEERYPCVTDTLSVLLESLRFAQSCAEDREEEQRDDADQVERPPL